jgi:hypothetical protein
VSTRMNLTLEAHLGASPKCSCQFSLQVRCKHVCAAMMLSRELHAGVAIYSCATHDSITASHLAPKMRATSAPRSAADLAALTAAGWPSGTTPRPMAVARKGSPVASTSCRSAVSACDSAAPFPTTSSGLHVMGVGFLTRCNGTSIQNAHARLSPTSSLQKCTAALPRARSLACTSGGHSTSSPAS